MNPSSSVQQTCSPPVTLVITPYHINGGSTWTYPGSLLSLLRAIVSDHSIPSTPYESAFYQDLNDRSCFYHLQTSPREPSSGWRSFGCLSSTPNQSRPEPSPPTLNLNSSILDATPFNQRTITPRPSLSGHLITLSAHATPQSSNGLITLGMSNQLRHPPPLTEIPFDAPLLLIGSRDIAVTSNGDAHALANARFEFETEMTGQLVQFRRFTSQFAVAGGWRERGYDSAATPADQSGDSHGDLHGIAAGNGPRRTAAAAAGEQFITLSGWKTTEDYARFRKLMVNMAAKTKMNGRDAYWDVESLRRISPDVVGRELVWGKRIA